MNIPSIAHDVIKFHPDNVYHTQQTFQYQIEQPTAKSFGKQK